MEVQPAAPLSAIWRLWWLRSRWRGKKVFARKLRVLLTASSESSEPALVLVLTSFGVCSVGPKQGQGEALDRQEVPEGLRSPRQAGYTAGVGVEKYVAVNLEWTKAPEESRAVADAGKVVVVRKWEGLPAEHGDRDEATTGVDLWRPGRAIDLVEAEDFSNTLKASADGDHKTMQAEWGESPSFSFRMVITAYLSCTKAKREVEVVTRRVDAVSTKPIELCIKL
jgi:hypothetical protein